MKREIEKGITIIHTQGDGLCTINKHGYRGVTTYGDKFRVEITVGKKNAKKYLIGTFDTISDAAKARRIAELKRHQKCLDEWIATKPHGNSCGCKEFWKNEFERFDEYENNKRNNKIPRK